MNVTIPSHRSSFYVFFFIADFTTALLILRECLIPDPKPNTKIEDKFCQVVGEHNTDNVS